MAGYVAQISVIESDEAANALRSRLESGRVNDDQVFSVTSAHQRRTENACEAHFDERKVDVSARARIKLYRSVHASYLRRGLTSLPRGYQGLDASQPWLCYWILNSLDLLELVPDSTASRAPVETVDPFKASGCVPVEADKLTQVVQFLATCAGREGGYGGGPKQLPHLAPTYAAVNALVVVGTREAFDSIDRRRVYNFLVAMKHESGGFRMHTDGEVDIRASYCAISVASLLNILDDRLQANTAKYIASCQTYEGGLGGEPGNEAHGGYTFCGVAAASILGCLSSLNLERLIAWVTGCQMAFEGGFQGRTNKLVDSCYSFWQGAVLPMIQGHREHTPSSNTVDAGLSHFDEDLSESGWLFNQRALQDYILLCCQQMGGGLKDKPGKNADYYHTCYSLNGLAAAQSNPSSQKTIVGISENQLSTIEPCYGVRKDKIASARQHFGSLSHPCVVDKQ